MAISKACVQWKPVYAGKNSACKSGLKLGTSRSPGLRRHCELSGLQYLLLRLVACHQWS